MGEKLLAINSTPAEIRIALIESSHLTELAIERERSQGIVGNVYKGKVTRVLPGMQSAFVEIGLDRTAFLFGGDVFDANNLEEKTRESLAETSDQEHKQTIAKVARTPIEQLIREGDQITVQVTKEPLGSKGARITTFISLPGRFLVMMPEFSHVGISRRIENTETRERLQTLAESIKPERFGIIMRTAAEHATEEELRREVEFLTEQWHMIQKKRSTAQAPSLLHQEPDFIQKTVRDWLSADITKILIDDKARYATLNEFLSHHMPNDREKLELYAGQDPLFDHLDVELDIARANGRKVWLPSGGHLVIDHTEALTTFDINTGRFVGKVSAQETILQTNLEAAAEIATQLRVRNIGGIIVIDFIDMSDLEDRVKVEQTLLKHLETDKAKNQVLKISDFGLVQMTRKRTREPLERQLMVECTCCGGRGMTPSISTHLSEMTREIERYCVRTKEKVIKVRLRKDLKEQFQNESRSLLKWLVKKHKIKIKLEELGQAPDHSQDPPYDIGQ